MKIINYLPTMCNVDAVSELHTRPYIYTQCCCRCSLLRKKRREEKKRSRLRDWDVRDYWERGEIEMNTTTSTERQVMVRKVSRISFRSRAQVWTANINTTSESYVVTLSGEILSTYCG